MLISFVFVENKFSNLIIAMDSSDSEDDCYGNIAQKLQKMKNRYKEDTIECTNLLNSSNEIDDIVKKANLPAVSETKSDPVAEKSVVESDNDEPDAAFIDNLIATSSRRVTRSKAKRSASDADCPVPKKSTRRKTRAKTPEPSNTTNACTDVNTRSNTTNVCNVNTSAASVVEDSANVSQNQRGRGASNSRGRGRGRGRGRSRGRRTGTILDFLIGNISTYNDANIPTYSVGNTDEYPDQSDTQTLFSTKKTDDVVVIEEENELDVNEELSVKVYWQSSEFFKFTIRKFQKLMQIFEYFAKKENVSIDRLLFTFNEKILKPDDTPDSIGYSIAKFIEGGVINNSVTDLIKHKKEAITDGIKLKFQCQNVKKPFETVVRLDEKLSIAMLKCAEHFEIAIDKLKFAFDGDYISGKSTPRELDLEGDECIDVKIVS